MTEPTASAGSGFDVDTTITPATSVRVLDGSPDPAGASSSAAGGMTSRVAAVRLRLGELAGSDPAEDHQFFTELWGSFADHALLEMRELAAALRCSAVGQVQSLAHSLKGSAANMGGDDLAACLAAVELQARNGQFEDTDDVVERVRQEYHALTRAYAVVLSELRPG